MSQSTITKTRSGSDVKPAERFQTPRTDIVEKADAYVIEAEMPGVEKSGIQITLDQGNLEIAGQRQVVNPPGTREHTESVGLNYRRVFGVDHSIDSQNIKATMQDGILRLELPKSEALKPRRIEIA